MEPNKFHIPRKTKEKKGGLTENMYISTIILKIAFLYVSKVVLKTSLRCKLKFSDTRESFYHVSVATENNITDIYKRV